MVALSHKSMNYNKICPGGIEFPLESEGWQICAVSYQGGFVTIGGCCDTHGAVERWKTNILVHFCFVQVMTPQASTLVPYLTFWKQGVVMPAHPSHLPKESRFTTVVNQYTCLFPNQGILVTGGTNDFEKLSSTEFFLPSNGLWKRGGELPRYIVITDHCHCIIKIGRQRGAPKCRLSWDLIFTS